MTFGKQLKDGIITQNPVLVQLLGLCSTLAITTSISNGLGMGVAVLIVLTCSNVVISLLRKIIPDQIRIAAYIVVIAGFVTIVDLLMQAYTEALYNALGIFIPLIVVNCIVLGRAEAFASKNGILASAMDGLGMGLGFTLALTVIGMIREFLAAGTLFQVQLSADWEYGFSVMGQAPGGFIVMGFVLAAMNVYNRRRAEKAGRTYEPPQGLDCRHCNICRLSETSFKKSQ